MAIRKNLSADSNNIEIIPKRSGISGNIKKIIINNTDGSNALVVTHLDHFDGSNEFQIISNVNIPVGASLVLSDNIAFDSNIYALRITTSNSATSTIIIN